jgi:hypothetical protein
VAIAHRGIKNVQATSTVNVIVNLSTVFSAGDRIIYAVVIAGDKTGSIQAPATPGGVPFDVEIAPVFDAATGGTYAAWSFTYGTAGSVSVSWTGVAAAGGIAFGVSGGTNYATDTTGPWTDDADTDSEYQAIPANFSDGVIYLLAMHTIAAPTTPANMTSVTTAVGDNNNSIEGRLSRVSAPGGPTFTPTNGTVATSQAGFHTGFAIYEAAVAPSNDTPPAVTGVELVGETLTTTDGEWSGTEPITFSYQWQSCPDDVFAEGTLSIGTDANTYVLTEDEEDLFIRCVVTASNAGDDVDEPSHIVGPIEGLSTGFTSVMFGRKPGRILRPLGGRRPGLG